MACTVAIEETIDEHYRQQLDVIKDEELKKTISKFRDEEIEHRNTGISYNAEEMPGYKLFTGIIKTGAKASIWLAKRV